MALVDGRPYLRHDSTEPFPLDDGSIGLVFSEHFIEHVTPGAGVEWLCEMRRLLRRGGAIRISTPDLRKYVQGYVDRGSPMFDEHRRRLELMLARFLQADARGERARAVNRDYLLGETEIPDRPAFMLNQVFLFPIWHHRWLYDLDELRHVAGRAGFPASSVSECGFRQGSVAELAALDAPDHDDESIYVEILRD
jgi:SAM-dependent methyltransferase